MDNRLSVREGESATINCSTIAFPDNITYTLTNNGTPITLAADNSYTIDPTRMQDAGIYTCTATNDVGTSVLNITLEVRSLPGQVSNIMVDDNVGNITLSWGAAEENGAEIIGYNIVINYKEIEKEFGSDGPATSITVTNEELVDLFSKGGEKIFNFTIIITAVNGIGEGEAVTEHETIKVECVPGQVSNIVVDDSDDNITILWDAAEENGAEITAYNIVIKYKEVENEFSSDGPATSITVTNEELRDLFSKGGEKMLTIIIKAVNGIGEGEAVTEQEAIIVEYVPGQVSNIMVDDNNDDITISWNAAEENGAEIVGYSIIIKCEEIEKEFSSDGPATSITVTNEELRDLFSKGGEKMLTIIITAVNGIGEGEAVTDQEAINVEYIPGQVSNIMVNMEENDITISWNAAEENGAEIIGYNIVIKYKEIENEFGSDGPATSITVTNEELRDLFSKGGVVMVTIIIRAENRIGEGDAVREEATLQPPDNNGALPELPHHLLSTLLVIFAYLIAF